MPRTHLMSQVYEVSNELVEVREEAELLRLQMEVAQQEEEAARNALAACQAALAAALVGPAEPVEAEAPQVRPLYITQQHSTPDRGCYFNQRVNVQSQTSACNHPGCLA